MILRSPFVSEKKALKEMTHSGLVNFFGALFNRSQRDYGKMLADPTTSSLIMAVVLWIVRRWPEAPVYLTDKKDNAIYDHPMLDLIQHPNKFYSGTSLWFGMLMSFIWDGNGYWIKIKNERDLSVRELWYVPHFHMEPKVNNGSPNFIDYYEYSPGGRNPIKLDPSDVVHFRYGIDPYNPRKGFSPLKSIARDALTDEEADNFSASMLMNMGVPGLIVSPDLAAGQSIDGKDIDAAKKYFETQFSGDKCGKPLVMKGPTKVVQFGFDPKSMDIASLRAIPEERVSAVTGIPAAVVGFGSGLAQTKVGATMKELREMAYEDGIIPIQRMIGPELETQLLPEFEPKPDTLRIAFDLSKVRVLQDDQDALYRRTIEAWNGGLISRAQGKQAIGFEAGPADEIRRVPFSVTEVAEGSMVEEYIPPDPTKSRKVQTKGIRRAERAFNLAQLRVYDRLRVAYSNDLVDGFELLASRVVDAYETYMSSNQLRGKLEGERKAIEDLTAQEVMDFVVSAQSVIAIAEANGALPDVLNWQGQYLAVAKATLNNVNAVFGINLDLTDPMQREILSKGGRHFNLVGVQKQTQDAVYQALAQARSEGLGPREVARLIRSNVEGASMYPGVYKEAYDRAIERGWSAEKAAGAGDRAARQYRAEVISRTETKYAQNVSSIEIAKGSGTFNAMLAFDDQIGYHDEDCMERNGQTFSFDEAEVETAAEHPNGSLSFAPTII
jgi:HK97 family phage portal protein